MAKELYDFSALLLHETEKAFYLDDGTKKFWVPKSIAENNGDKTFTVPVWWAEKEGLI